MRCYTKHRISLEPHNNILNISSSPLRDEEIELGAGEGAVL